MFSCNAWRFYALRVSTLALFFAPVVIRHATAADAPAPKVSAKALAAAFVKNEVAAAKKYGDAMNPKVLIIEGTVGDVVNGKYGKIARLEGEGKVIVSCLLRKEDEASVKKGDKVTFEGKCRGLFKRENLVDINGAVLLKKKDK